MQEYQTKHVFKKLSLLPHDVQLNANYLENFDNLNVWASIQTTKTLYTSICLC